MRPLLCWLMLTTCFANANDFNFDFDHLALEVKDVNASAAFYQQVLQLDEIYDGTEKDHIRWFSLASTKAGGNRQLHLIETKHFQSQSIKGVHLSVATVHFDAFVAHLRANSIAFENWPGEANNSNSRPDSVRQVYIKDPDGYWIEINDASTQWPVADGSLGQFDNHLSVGNPKHQGSVNYDADTQQYSITGAGANMWFKQDQMHFLYKRLQGDFILRARVAFVGEGVDPHRKVGWTVRKNLDTDAAQVTGVVHGDGLTSLQYRPQTAADTVEVRSEDIMPEIVQLERRGNTYILSTAKFGETFKTVSVQDVQLGDNPYIGLFVCSHNADVIEQGIFSNVRIITPAATDFKPYQDYIGSNLELMDVQTGARKIIHRTENSIQAPNWTRDGSKLIYNSEGKLFNFDLAQQQVSELESGFAIKNNNDHVLSWQGDHIAISHHNEDDNNNSAIYILPITGSATPQKITAKGVGASYLHGWSLDDKNLVFTAHRHNQYDIYSINIASGRETQLTNTKTLDDGSEFSPDGKHIYFNSNRSGTMQIWRMNADGSEQTQLTDDQYNDWFPHISPDGKQMVMLSFMADIDSGDHPFYKHVYLRSMPTDLSQKPKVIAYIYGGQGTINVPSWSPDGKTISFVSNSVIKLD